MTERFFRAYVVVAFFAGVAVTIGVKHAITLLPRRAVDETRLPFDEVVSSQFEAASREVQLKDNSRSIDTRAGLITVDGIEGCVGNTPLIKIKSLSAATGCTIMAKAEFMNGAGNSPKDRVALNIIRTAEEEGRLKPWSGDTIYEGTVGSTGIRNLGNRDIEPFPARLITLGVNPNSLGLEQLNGAGDRGVLKLILRCRCMPDDQATEKSDLLLKLGAEVERVPPTSIVDVNQFVNKARSRAAEHTADKFRPGRGFFADQFETEANWKAHYTGTGPEIYFQTGSQLDAFVAGAGTGGTISGVALYLKPRIPNLKVILADPQGSGLFNKVKFGVMFDSMEREGTRRRHQVDTMVEGIGINRVTHNFEVGRALVDDAIRVTDEQAIRMAKWLVEKDGIFVGSSSAVNCVAAAETALRLGRGHTIVTVLCDSGTRHLSKFWARAGGSGGGSQEATLEDILNQVSKS